MDRVHEWLEHRGHWGLFFGYFIPGVRHLTALVAGTSRMEYPMFAMFAYTGGLVWSVSFITAGYFLGKEWVVVSTAIEKSRLVVFVFGFVILAYLLQRHARTKN